MAVIDLNNNLPCFKYKNSNPKDVQITVTLTPIS